MVKAHTSHSGSQEEAVISGKGAVGLNLRAWKRRKGPCQRSICLTRLRLVPDVVGTTFMSIPAKMNAITFGSVDPTGERGTKFSEEMKQLRSVVDQCMSFA